MTKTKFDIGSLVKASSRLNICPATSFHVWPKQDKIEYFPTRYRRITPQQRNTLLRKDVGVVTRIEKLGSNDTFLYQVRFLQTGLDLVLHERQLKWAK
jgi:hypothetical protein